MISDALSVSPRTADGISQALGNTIRVFDQCIQDGVTDLFPGGVEGLEKMTDEEVNAIVPKNRDKLLLGMRGTTALIALVDERKENLWIANLGDCLAGKSSLNSFLPVFGPSLLAEQLWAPSHPKTSGKRKY